MGRAFPADGDRGRAAEASELRVVGRQDTSAGQMNIDDDAFGPGGPDQLADDGEVVGGGDNDAQSFHVVTMVLNGRTSSVFGVNSVVIHGCLPADHPFMAEDIFHQTIPVHRCRTDGIGEQACHGDRLTVAHLIDEIGRGLIRLVAQQMKNGTQSCTFQSVAGTGCLPDSGDTALRGLPFNRFRACPSLALVFYPNSQQLLCHVVSATD